MTTLKRREKPEILILYQDLDKRRKISYEEKKTIVNLTKGYEGECKFDDRLEKYLDDKVLILNDLLLTIKGSSVQIDSLIITESTVYLYEVKNYEGNYVMRKEQFLTLHNQEIAYPLTQLNRATSLLRQLFSSWKIDIKIESSIVFINPSFVLYEAKVDAPFIFSGQIDSHLTKISQEQINLFWQTDIPNQLAEKLMYEHEKEAPFQIKGPIIDYEKLRRGITCISCGSFDLIVTQRAVKCLVCKETCPTDKAILKHIEEFKRLFPERKVTVSSIFEWCGHQIARSRTRNVLTQNYRRLSSSKGTHYI